MGRCKHYDYSCKKEEMTCEGCAYFNADEFFEDIGLVKEETEDYICYSRKLSSIILCFDKKRKYCTFEGINALTPIEVKAICKKMEELKW